MLSGRKDTSKIVLIKFITVPHFWLQDFTKGFLDTYGFNSVEQRYLLKWFELTTYFLDS